MQTQPITTPFGRRPLTLGQISSQIAARNAPEQARVNKWQVFRHIREARELIGATDRSLAILNALLSFHQETELSAEGGLIVWPSNEQLMARANGISPATLRRHLAVLVECGLIIRRDSPNGKRFARRGQDGAIEAAYGFDLSPLLARAEEFQDMAEAVQREQKAHRMARERLTLLRRDLVKMIEAGIEEGAPGDWAGWLEAYRRIIARLPRTAPRQLLEDLCMDLFELRELVGEALESFADSRNLNAKESQNERHIQNSNPDSRSESEQAPKRSEAGTAPEDNGNVRSLPKRDLPLGIVLDACPAMLEMAPSGEIRHWRDLVETAGFIRPMLGISPSAWDEAREVLGEREAAITLAAIHQRAARINSPGGYLRSLTDRAREGRFSSWPMIMALLREKLEARGDGAGEGTPPGGMTTVNRERLEISDALRRSLKRSP